MNSILHFDTQINPNYFLTSVQKVFTRNLQKLVSYKIISFQFNRWFCRKPSSKNNCTNLLLFNIGILWKISRFNFVDHFERWEQALLIGARISAFREPIPVIASYANQITNIHKDLLVIAWMMCDHCLPIMRILSAIIVDIVERFKSSRCVRIRALHDFVGHSAHLRAECADEVVRL